VMCFFVIFFSTQSAPSEETLPAIYMLASYMLSPSAWRRKEV
jgi:hypothetical protein